MRHDFTSHMMIFVFVLGSVQMHDRAAWEPSVGNVIYCRSVCCSERMFLAGRFSPEHLLTT
jgi:hypothetical protein